MSDFAIFDANPASAIPSESPLAISRIGVTTLLAATAAAVSIRERAFLGHLVLRGKVADADFQAAVQQVLGVPLPLRLGLLGCDEAAGVSIQWLSPDEWLVIVPGGTEYAVELRLRAALKGHYAIFNVSGGQTIIELSGRAAREVLMKSTAYDLDPANFPVGKAVGSTFAKTTALIRRVGEERWELVVRRSFADYLYGWLLDASEEYGVFVAA